MSTHQHSSFNSSDKIIFRISGRLTIPTFILEIHVDVKGRDGHEFDSITNQHTTNHVSTYPTDDKKSSGLSKQHTQHKHCDNLVLHCS